MEKQQIWTGLAAHPEGADVPGGLTRYDRRDGSVEEFPVVDLVNVIGRFGDSLWIGTCDGLYRLKGQQLFHLRTEVDPKGHFYLE
ncbi:MAG: hypothetical protein ACE5JX_22280 [Acidobacteriota bacterium]